MALEFKIGVEIETPLTHRDKLNTFPDLETLKIYNARASKSTNSIQMNTD